jgi:gamma-glutamyltranspeptidase / glutathione hydrolase
VSHRPLTHGQSARGSRGAVASPHFLASQVGLEVLKAGGSAVDAAIATNAALSVVAAHSCGLGGDAFWLVWDGQEVHGLNGSGASAQAATLDAARSAGLQQMPPRGPWTVTVPGAIHSWAEAHSRFGRLAWAELLLPAAELADGFTATDGWIGAIERSARVFGTDGDWARTFRPANRPWRTGETVRLPALARTLRLLADEGPSVAYEGQLAERAGQYLAGHGSPLRAGDFREHRSEWVEPISIGYRGYESVSLPANSSGPTALELLGLLERFEAGADEARWVHIGLQAAKLALADREAHLTDPRHMDPATADRLLAPDRLDRLAAMIDPDRLTDLPASPALGGGTIYLATADSDGSMVSLLESNYAGFGSGLVDPQTGIAYQNRGAFFSLDAGHANVLAPGKRTVHTLVPGLLMRDGRPWIAHGSMGGEIQPLIYAQLVSAVVDRRTPVDVAVAGPRWATHHAGDVEDPSLAVLEDRFDQALVDGLRQRGHRVELVEPYSSALGHCHAIEASEDGYLAASDPRVEGAALGW